MSVIKVSAVQFKAVSVAKAVKDIREQLTGVYMAPNGDMVATDSHRMCVAQDAFTPSEDFMGVIINFTAKIPAKCVNIEFNTDTQLASALGIVDECLGKFSFEIINYRFPDYQRVFNLYNKAVDSKMIGMNYDYLADIKKIFSSCKLSGVKIEINGTESFMVSHDQLPNVKYLMLGCRL